MSYIDISDLDICLVIKALWNNMEPASFFRYSGIKPPPEPSADDIMSQLENSKYIDYLNGRCIKTDFSDLTKVDTRLYNRDAGNNAFENIVAQLR